MRKVFRRASTDRRPPRRRALLAIVALPAALALVPVLAATAGTGGDTAAGRLHLSLTRAAKFSGRAVGAPARRLAGGLAEEADAVGDLIDPAGTTEEEIGKALAELREMGSLANLDPHYAPALLAAGRAYMAASGRDPVGKSTLNPEYLGLERELGKGREGLDGLAKGAGKLSERVRRLTKALLRARRLARGLERAAQGRAGRR